MKHGDDGIGYGDLIGGLETVLTRFKGILADLGPEREAHPLLFRLIGSHLHGPDHWVRVGVHALAIARSLRRQGRIGTQDLAAAGALEDAAVLASFFHDCARGSEGADLGHGREGERVWRSWAIRQGVPKEIAAAVSQAILFHVDHPAVDPRAREAAICLANADRLDRVRLGGERPVPGWMYDDGCWRGLERHSRQLLFEVGPRWVRLELGIGGA